jgi:hypothetical protein
MPWNVAIHSACERLRLARVAPRSLRGGNARARQCEQHGAKDGAKDGAAQ